MIVTIAVIALILCTGGYFIKDIYFPSRKTDRQRTLQRYKKVQDLSLELQGILTNYIFSENTAQDIITEGITYSAYLDKLEKGHEKCLSDYGYNKLKYGCGSTYRQKIKRDLAVQAKELNIAKKHILPLQKQKSLAY